MAMADMAVFAINPRLAANGNHDVETAAHFHTEESGRRHADHFHRMTVERNLLANGCCVSTELALRETVARDSRRRAAAGAVVVSREQSSGRRLDAQRSEIVA